MSIPEIVNAELSIHSLKFVHIRSLSDVDLKSELAQALKLEEELAQPLVQAQKNSSLSRDSVFGWFESCGGGGKHFAFQKICNNSDLDF
jgi:hypothetical protein